MVGEESPRIGHRPQGGVEGSEGPPELQKDSQNEQSLNTGGGDSLSWAQLKNVAFPHCFVVAL
jgi:hypothetical protein